MADHPLNLLLRFLLEIVALVAIGYWAWTSSPGSLKFTLGIGVPILAAVIWATFRVNGDPGLAPVAVPGALRLLIELIVLLGGVLALYLVGRNNLAIIFAVLLILHYVMSYDRIEWLLKQ